MLANGIIGDDGRVRSDVGVVSVIIGSMVCCTCNCCSCLAIIDVGDNNPIEDKNSKQHSIHF